MRVMRDGGRALLGALLAVAVAAGPAAALNGLEILDNSFITLRQERPGVPDDQFGQVAKFTLPPDTDIDPVTETVIVSLTAAVCQGEFSRLIIPPGNFEARVGGKIIMFDGVVVDAISGEAVVTEIRFTRERNRVFKVSFSFKDADYACLEGLPDEFVTTVLTVGGIIRSGSICYKRLNDGDLFWPGGQCGN